MTAAPRGTGFTSPAEFCPCVVQQTATGSGFAIGCISRAVVFDAKAILKKGKEMARGRPKPSVCKSRVKRTFISFAVRYSLTRNGPSAVSRRSVSAILSGSLLIQVRLIVAIRRSNSNALNLGATGGDGSRCQ